MSTRLQNSVEPEIDVLIVTYNSAEIIADCLRSLDRARQHLSLSVHVVDNASSDNTVDLVSQWPQAIHIIQERENNGFAAGSNAALRHLLADEGRNVPILLLNPDAVLSDGALQTLYDTLYSSDAIGCVGPWFKTEMKSGGPGRPYRSLSGLSGPSHFDGRSGLFEVDRLTGACLLVKREAFRSAGLLEESYFLYFEDIDLCYRVRKAGYRVVLSMETIVDHHLDRKEPPHRIFYISRNQFRFAKLHYGPAGRIAFMLRRLLLTSSREIARFLVFGDVRLCRAALAGLWCGLRGETGKSVIDWSRF